MTSLMWKSTMCKLIQSNDCYLLVEKGEGKMNDKEHRTVAEQQNYLPSLVSPAKLVTYSTVP